MRQSTLNLAPWLALAWMGSGALADKRPFNINDDILAYPQFQVKFPDEYILDSHAEELLQAQSDLNYEGTYQDQKDPQIYTGNVHANDATQDSKYVDGPKFAYEEMILDDRRLLCQIPQVHNDETNTTAGNKPTEADEQKELARATDRGLELLRELEGKCMYYFSGWWSYSFCYRQQVKQFHALPAGRGGPHYPPAEDPHTHSFILGQFPADSKDQDKEGAEAKKSHDSELAELHTKGGSRYLVQHLSGGTKCDLTGRERRIEVQFHCHPQSTDQIGWIKELTTCSYLMVIYTPRLCDDAAFMPPRQDEVNEIECREILMPDEVTEWQDIKEWYLAQRLVDEARTLSDVQTVGGIEVGARKLVGMEGKQIEKGRVASIGEEHVDILATRENGEVKQMSKQALKKYDLDPEKLENLKKQVERMAGDDDWVLEVVELNGGYTFRGGRPDEDTEETKKKKEQKKAESDSEPVQQQYGGNEDDNPIAKEKEPEAQKAAAQKGSSNNEQKPESLPNSEKEPEHTEGSEETFKDEL
ncbi:hypothetical protein N7478_000355 [Penicillium angulare]|uniref:uncharacterized protein n=1 Tax=Penicillium angulare TaxID=116970 RepID=UPI0025410110|nr:uncharacterized protein N7478_000355 [Penicillium angulare]KAJ5291104.1 hypothetical protein N7478_000355 [Penicillium angulare]